MLRDPRSLLGVGLLMALPLSGCSSQTDAAAQPGTSVTSATPVQHGASSAQPTATSSAPKADAASGLSAALYALAEQSRNLHTDSLSGARKTISSSMSTARASLKRARQEAYGADRNCSSLTYSLQQIRDAANRTFAANTTITQQIGSKRAQVDKTNRAIAAVKSEFSKPNAADGTSASDVRDAVASATDQVQKTTTALNDAGSASRQAIAALGGILTAVNQLSSKC